MKKRLLIGLLLVLAFASCHSPQRNARQMVRRAEQLSDTLPDSTARLIDSVLRMPVYFSERQRMDMALLQAEALFGCRDTSAKAISPLMDEDFFDDKPYLSTSPDLERAAAYYARKKKYGKASHAALYSGFVQQHYNDKAAAMQSFKDAEHYAGIVRDSLIMAQAQCLMGQMLYNDGMEQEALVMLKNSENGLGYHFTEKAFVQNKIAVCYLVLGEYESAELYLQKCLKFSEKAHLGKVKRKALNNFAVLYQIQGKNDQAIACLKQDANKSDFDKKELLLLNLNLGNVFFGEGEMDSAAYYFKYVDSLLLNAQVKSETKASAYNSLSKFAENQHDDSLALYYWKRFDNWLNEVRDKQEQNNVYGIQQKYDYRTLQNVMSLRVIRRQRLIIILSVVVALVLLAFAISQIRLARIKRQEAEIKASLFHFMQQNKELEQKSVEQEKNSNTMLAEYKSAYNDCANKLSDAWIREQRTMQKLAVYLNNDKDAALLGSLRQTVFGNYDYWEAMMKAFDKRFPSMRKKLIQQNHLSDNELKILLLSYIDTSRDDTALLLGISIHMVDKLRTSVKKKMQEKD